MHKNPVELLKEMWQKKLHENQGQTSAQLQLYIPAMLGASESVSTENRKDAIAEIQQFLNSDNRLLLLLGDSGSGKTLFGQWLTNEFWQHPKEWMPIFIHLPSMNIKKGFFDKYLQKKCRLTVEESDYLKKECKILLILDAFDEMKAESQKQNLYQLGDFSDWQIKIIISSRTEALVSLKDNTLQLLFETDHTRSSSPKLPLQKRYVQAFNRSQITPYIETWKKCNPDLIRNDIDYEKVLNTLPGLMGMIANPFILWTVMFSLPKIFDKYAHESLLERNHLTRLALYDNFTLAWFERQRDKLFDNGLINKIWSESIIDDFQNYCQQLANVLWQQNNYCIKYEYIPKVAPSPSSQAIKASTVNFIKDDKYLGDLFFAPVGNFDGDSEKPLRLIRQGALLKIEDGNKYSFLHHSLLEYFAATTLFASAQNKASIALSMELNSQLLNKNPAIIQLGVDLIQNNRKANDLCFENALWDIIEESKYDKRIQIAAANSATLLTAARISFAGRDLRRIRIQGADLTGGNFDGTDLRESDLRDVNISQAWIANTLLNGACLDRIIDVDSRKNSEDEEIAGAFTKNGKKYILMSKLTIKVFQSRDQTLLLNQRVKLGQDEYLSAFAVMNHSDTLIIGTSRGNILKMFYKTGNILDLEIGHNGKINAIALSDNESRIFTGSTDHTIMYWDIENAKRIRTFKGHSESVMLLTISLDGQWAVSASEDNFIKYWKVDTGECLDSWKACTNGKIHGLLANKNCQRILSLASEGITCLQIESQKLNLKWIITRYYHSGILALSLDEKQVLSCNHHGTIYLWDIETGQDINVFLSHNINILATWFDSVDNIVQFIDKNNAFKEVNITTMITDVTNIEIDRLSINLDRNSIISHSIDNSIRIFDINTGQCVDTSRDFTPEKTGFNSIAVSSDSKWAISVMNDTNVKRWNLETGECVWSVTRDSRNIIQSLILCSNDAWFLLTSDNQIERRDSTSGKFIGCCRIKDCASDPPPAISPDNLTLLHVGYDRKIKLWNIQTGECIWSVRGHKYYCYAFAISPDNKWALSISLDIKRWDMTNGKCLGSWKEPVAVIRTIVISPDCKWAIFKSLNEIILWNIELGKIMNSFRVEKAITSICWQVNNLIIIGMNDGGIGLWSFQPEKAILSMIWRTKNWKLCINKSELLGVYGLPNYLEELCLANGVNVQVSAKYSEDKVIGSTIEKGILSRREALIPYNINKPQRGLFDTHIHLRPNAWIVSLVRRTQGEGSNHAFLLLESIEDNNYRIRRMDFFIERRYNKRYQNSSENPAITVFGVGLIEITEISLFDAESLAKSCIGLSTGIGADQGTQLLKNIRDDQSERIGYCYMGSSPLYRIFRMKNVTQQHNCISWCEKHLDKIGISDLAKKNLLEGFVHHPKLIVPNKK